MRILIWHGYLLNGTGSNVYTRALARVLTQMGHEVVVLCQDPDPAQFDLGTAVVVRPRLDSPLPVFVLDRYADMEPQLLPEMARADVDRFVNTNAAAIRAQGPADLLITNHVLLGGPVGAASGLPFIVKAHGSELEFAMRGNEGLCRWAHEAIAPARAVLAGSHHIESVLAELVHPAAGQVVVIPPGVDVDEMRPADRTESLAALLGECRADAPNPPGPEHDERRPDDGTAERLERFLTSGRRTILYVGKLSREKGVGLLLDAARGLDAQVLVVGFGPARTELERGAGPDVLFTGPLEHRHLQRLWPLVTMSVVPSVAPEAFGMVAAEAAACGAPPVVARHSGLAEIATGLAQRYPEHYRELVSFASGDAADLRRVLAGILALTPEQWQEVSAAARRAAVDLWSWQSVAERILVLAD